MTTPAAIIQVWPRGLEQASAIVKLERGGME